MRTGHLVGLVALVVASLTGACVPRQPDPLVTVRALHAALDAGDWEQAHGMVDYRYRLAEMLGELFEKAPKADQDAALALARGMFVNTTEMLWKTHYAGRPTTTRVTKREGAHVWVESLADGDHRPSFIFRYRLTPRDGAWKVTQREYLVGPNRSNTAVFYPMAVKKLAAELGRQPTLAELNANLPSLQGRMKMRTYKVPELPPKSRQPKSGPP